MAVGIVSCECRPCFATSDRLVFLTTQATKMPPDVMTMFTNTLPDEELYQRSEAAPPPGDGKVSTEIECITWRLRV